MNGSYFVNIFQAQKPVPSICGEPSDDEYVYRNITEDKILNSPISEDEVRQSIKSLKNNNSLGPSDILNEMISSGHNILMPFLARVFRRIFERGSFPYEWGRSIIIPIHKKGDINVCDNFRPISLTSLVLKVYTNTLNRRLTLFTDALGLLPEEQAGFREGYSTVDHSFFSLSHGSKLKTIFKESIVYVAFIDYRKCFDSINRLALFKTLECNRITGTFLNAIKALYTTVLAAVRNNGERETISNVLLVLNRVAF